MIEAAITYIAICTAYILAFCFHTLSKRYKWLEERNTSRRREFYRRKAYGEKQKTATINENRKYLWEVIK